jgi:hypothetical protein
MPQRVRAELLQERQSHFHEDRKIRRKSRFRATRWWWDRFRRDSHYRLIEGIDLLLQPVLAEYPPKLYEQLLAQVRKFIGHPAVSMPYETALLSRLNRWLKRRAAPSFAQDLSRDLSKQMLKHKQCPWWYVMFMANFAPTQLQKLALKLAPEWCEMREHFLNQRYQSFGAIQRQLQQWRQNKAYQRVLHLQELGKSTEGRSLWGLRLGYGQRDQRPPTVVLVGTQHGDEHLGADLLMTWLEQILERYQRRDAQIVSWFRSRHIWVIPVLNPDGKEFDLQHGVIKWWRFTRSVQSDGQIGVDLNRNFCFQWKNFQYYSGGRVTLPGSHPFSEPESRALSNLLWNIHNFTALLDIHQYGNVILIPHAHTRERLPGPYHKLFMQISHYLAEHNRYRVWPARRLYQHEGTLGDWGWGRHKILSLVLELGREQYLTPSQAKIVINLNLELLNRFVDLAPNPFVEIQNIMKKNKK